LTYARSTMLLAVALSTMSCSTPLPPDAEMVTWYAINSAGSMRIVVYDIVCKRRMGNLRLSGRRETPVTSCADENGRANVRYRPEGYANQVEGWTYVRPRPNQRIFVQ